MKGTWEEVQEKLRVVRGYLGDDLALRLKGIDWFAWITGGGSSAVLLASETGIAEVGEGSTYRNALRRPRCEHLFILINPQYSGLDLRS